MKVDLVQPNTKKKKKSILIKIKPKERKDMVVLQIYILGFPIDLKKKKKSFTRLSSFYLVYTEDSFEMRFLL